MKTLIYYSTVKIHLWTKFKCISSVVYKDFNLLCTLLEYLLKPDEGPRGVFSLTL